MLSKKMLIGVCLTFAHPLPSSLLSRTTRHELEPSGTLYVGRYGYLLQYLVLIAVVLLLHTSRPPDAPTPLPVHPM